mmetsp:Transcript_16512/g.51804  ORF Transcript_16512/g.51804 Transcript_16512/m.51804 type:complete len:118 (-) Transcript_16512:169-522(-)
MSAVDRDIEVAEERLAKFKEVRAKRPEDLASAEAVRKEVFQEMTAHEGAAPAQPGEGMSDGAGEGFVGAVSDLQLDPEELVAWVLGETGQAAQSEGSNNEVWLAATRKRRSRPSSTW